MPRATRRAAASEGQPDADSHWQSIIARSLAYLCLHTAKLTAGDLASQAQFVMNLGFSRSEAARLLNTTDDSLRILMGRKKKGARRGNARGEER